MKTPSPSPLRREIPPRICDAILLVEDDPAIRGAVRELLEDEGYDVRACRNGQEAMECLQAEPMPKVILTDLLMPVMDGFELVEYVRNDASLAGIPMVLMTASERRPPLPEGVRLLKKPLSVDALLQALRDPCASRAPARAWSAGSASEAPRGSAASR